MSTLFSRFGYVVLPPLTGALEEDVRALLLANGKPKTFTHVSEVAEVCRSLASRFGLDVEACTAAGLLHDISAVISPSDMLTYACERGLELCEAELRYPFLLHQRLSRTAAAEHFGVTDSRVLSAIECHTTLRADASGCDMALFIADKLAWDREGVPQFYDSVSAALDRGLAAACLDYMTYMEISGELLCPHTNWTLARDWLRNI